ncbi:MAG TPA: YncE family protein [Terriglobales bacterium]|nr:YncE family protein [Terriglobales bacterium]
MRVLHSIFLVLLLATGALAAELRQIAIIDLPGEPGFDGLAFAGGFLLISHTAANTLDVFDPQKRRLVAQVKDIPEPQGVAVDERVGRAYVSNGRANRISVISTRDWKVVDTIATQAAPYALALSTDGKLLFAANWRDKSITVVEVGAGNRVRTERVDGTPYSLAYDPKGRVLYASMQDLQEVATFDESLKLVRRLRLVASQPTGLALDAEARRLYVAVRHAVVAVQLDSGTEVGRVAAPPGADTLWLDKASGTLYAASGGGFVTTVRADGSVFQTIDEIHTNVRGHTLAYDPQRQFVYLPGGREGKSKLLILRRVSGAAPTQTTEISEAP